MISETRNIVPLLMSSPLLARLLMWLASRSTAAALLTCWGPTYLGPRYPRGMFGAVDAGEETAVRWRS